MQETTNSAAAPSAAVLVTELSPNNEFEKFVYVRSRGKKGGGNNSYSCRSCNMLFK